MFATISYSIFQSAPSGESTLSHILESLPTDPASLVTIGLLLGSLALVLWFGRPGGSGGTPSKPA